MIGQQTPGAANDGGAAASTLRVVPLVSISNGTAFASQPVGTVKFSSAGFVVAERGMRVGIAGVVLAGALM
jgi:hypothetical protein